MAGRQNSLDRCSVSRHVADRGKSFTKLQTRFTLSKSYWRGGGGERLVRGDCRMFTFSNAACTFLHSTTVNHIPSQCNSQWRRSYLRRSSLRLYEACLEQTFRIWLSYVFAMQHTCRLISLEQTCASFRRVCALRLCGPGFSTGKYYAMAYRHRRITVDP